MAQIHTVSSLKDVSDWYGDPDHYAVNKYFDVIAVVKKEEEREEFKVLLSLRDESVKDLKVLIDQTRWDNAIDRYREYGKGSIIFLQRAYVPKEEDILIAAFICVIDCKPALSQSGSRLNHANSFPSWSPHHIIVANDSRIRLRIRQLREFIAEQREAGQLVEAGPATASRSMSLDSTRLSLDMTLDSTDVESEGSDEHTASPEDEESVANEQEANKSENGTKKIHDEMNSEKEDGGKQNEDGNNSHKESERDEEQPGTEGPDIPEDNEMSEKDATVIEKSLNSTLKDEDAEKMMTIDFDRVSPIHGDSSNSPANSLTSSMQSEIYDDVTDHFLDDADEHEVPYIDCVPAGQITSLRDDNHGQNFHLIKGILVDCNDFETIGEKDPATLQNRLRLCNLITLFCSECHNEVTLRKYLFEGAKTWLESLSVDSVDSMNNFQCLECIDRELSMTFKIVFHIQEIIDDDVGSDDDEKRPEAGVKMGLKVKACLTGVSSLLYFGQRPQEALLNEHSAELVLRAVRVHVPKEGEFLPRFWYMLKLDQPIGEVHYSIITIVQAGEGELTRDRKRALEAAGIDKEKRRGN